MADDNEGIVAAISELTPDGELVESRSGPNQAQIGIAIGVAALIAVLIAVVVVASRR